jgi:putative ABC transport system substrate-binding protein
MRRREFILALAGVAVTWPLAARAQEAAMPVLGFMSARSPEDSVYVLAAFHKGLQESGLVDGRNVRIEYRWARGDYGRLPALTAAFVNRRVNVLVATGGDASARAAKAATSTISIVFITGGDPVEAGLVESFNRPGGNVTGLSNMEAELGGKRLDLLREAIPGLARSAVLAAKTDPFTSPFVQDLQTSAARVGLQLHPVMVSGPGGFEDAFATMSAAGDQAVIIQPNFLPKTAAIVALAAKHRLPILSSYRDTTRAGGLISYSADHAAHFQRAAMFIDKILKGAKPAELPVEQPTKFELVINLQTAKALGLDVPPTLLARADEVIE